MIAVSLTSAGPRRLQTRSRRAGSLTSTAGGRPRPRGADADHDVLALGEIAAQDLGGRAIADPQRELHGLELVAVHDPHAARRAALRIAPGPAGARRLVVANLLLGRQDLADPRPGGLADLLGPLLALALGRVPERLHLLPALLQDRIEL